MNRLDQLYKKLGLNKKNGLFFLKESENWVHKFPYRISRILQDVIKPDAFFCIYSDQKTSSDHPHPFNESFILFFDNPSDEKENEIHRHVINFGHAQAIFINRDKNLDLFHGNDFDISEIKQLRHLKSSEELDAFNDFSFTNILRGNSLKRLGVKKNIIDEYLLNNITDARRILVAKDGLKLNPKVANRLIGRLLFVSYLIDRNVTFNDQTIITGDNKAERKENFKSIIDDKAELYNFFQYLNDKYNGDMFPLYEEHNGKTIYDEISQVKKSHLDILFHLFNCSKFFKAGDNYNGYSVQKSLFDIYDFEIIPVELISSIYENFIGNELENEKLNLSKQKSIKAYYTPPFLVDFVLSQTVTPYLDDSDDSNCKVLDPACGSGIFLVETLRKIIEKELYISNKKKVTDAKLWKLIKSNIYGIDIDSDAIDISIFSLYVTILDYKQPAEIERFKFKKLKDENFFGGYDADFFNVEHKFNNSIGDINFIIGNPPWGHVKNSVYIDYIKKRDQVENAEKDEADRIKLQIGDKEICQAFIIRTSDFASEQSTPKCCFIVSSKVLYNSQKPAKIFRNYFLSKFHIKQVVELSPINNKIRGGNQLFENAKQPPAIITFVPEKNGALTYDNVVQHITVKPNRFFTYYKTIVVEKHDVKNIQQRFFISRFGGFDWLWKVLVYGNALDIHFIKRLLDKNNYKPALEYFNEYGFEYKGGLKVVDGKNKNNTSHLLKFRYLDADKEFKPFIVSPSKKWEDEVISKNIKDGEVGYIPAQRFFVGEKLLIKKGVVLKPKSYEHHFQAVTSYTDKELCFSSTVCSIIPTSKASQSKEFLSTLSGLFNSKLFTYFLLHTSPSAGVERSRINFSDYFKFPIVLKKEIGELALQTSSLLQDFDSGELLKTKLKLEKAISKAYYLSEIEKSLIDYTTEVTIPTLLREENSIVFKEIDLESKNDESYLAEYSDTIVNFFKAQFNKANKKITTQIRYNNYFIRIDFKVNTEDNTDNIINKLDSSELEELFGELSIYQVCKDLYFQQDFRGFTPDSFYIIKPNERKLWHKAVAHLDAIEFQQELTKAEVKRKLTS